MTTDPVEKFRQDRRDTVEGYGRDPAFAQLSQDWLRESMQRRYVYNFDWLGRPVIQYPQDIVALQDLIWRTRPDVVVETGIAHGGSLVLSASILALLDYADAAQQGVPLDPAHPARRVVGVDIDIRAHNRAAIEAHPMAARIGMIEGSSVEPATVAQVRDAVGEAGRVMVCLDSMHTHDHVLAELRAYAPLVTPDCYIVVFDSFIEDMPKGFFKDRPWDVGNNARTAIHAFLEETEHFEIDAEIATRLQVTAAPDGFLRRRQRAG